MDGTPLSERDLHRVSTKAAIFTPDHSHVLVMHMFPAKRPPIYALPGGHVDQDEFPDATIVREIKEELGIDVDIASLRHADFFPHKNGKIVLAYIGTLAHATAFYPSNPEKEIGIWMNHADFETITIEPGYKKLVLDNWQQ